MGDENKKSGFELVSSRQPAEVSVTRSLRNILGEYLATRELRVRRTRVVTPQMLERFCAAQERAIDDEVYVAAVKRTLEEMGLVYEA